MKIHSAFVVAVAASTLAAGCSFTSNTRTVEPGPVATRTVVTETPVAVAPATTTTVYTTTR
jgi:hypothetical protein